MSPRSVIERVERIAATRVDRATDRAARSTALVDVRRVRAWLDAAEADLARALAAEVSFPEEAIAASSQESLSAASRTLDRSRMLDELPSFATALGRGEVTAGHVDAVTRVAKGLADTQREALLQRVDALTDVAAAATVAQFGRRVRDEARRIAVDDGIDRLDRQRRATSLRTWVDDEGMWNLRGRFDPVTGARIAARVDHGVAALFHDEPPDSCPSDPLARHLHLRALALESLIAGRMADRGAGRPEFVVVVDAGAPRQAADTTERPEVTWSIPVEVPWRVLTELAADADVHAVVVRNGVVLYAPGPLDLGRGARHASREQRRALSGLYSTCAVPGCAVHYDRCKLHHLIWWSHGGRTDLDNLLPLCSHHHHRVHDAGWQLELGPHRELTVRFPDGTVRNTGPPDRRTA